MKNLRKTTPARHLTFIRIVSAMPLLAIGTQHLIGMVPMEPILEGAGFPLVSFFAITVPVLEVLMGLALVVGFYARVGALISLGIMVGAIYAHLVHDWADEPVLLLPVAVLLGTLQVLWSGAGAFSSDLVASDG